MKHSSQDFSTAEPEKVRKPRKTRRSEPAGATPMMQQYFEIKAANPDMLLFYRMGDFYELFFHDAEEASRALGIALTKRGQHLGEDIPMCGVPARSADEYLHKLIALGHRVAVCEQLEDPREAKARGAKSVVKRDVVRLITAGTLTEEALLEKGEANYLAALTRAGRAPAQYQYGLAWVDISTGEFRIANPKADTVESAVARIAPKEIIAARDLIEDPELARLWSEVDASLTEQPGSIFDSTIVDRKVLAFFNVQTSEALGSFSPVELAAMAGIISYIERTQIGAKPALNRPTREAQSSVLAIDSASRRNLELTRTLTGERRGTLAHAIDHTRSAAGGRLLLSHLASPLTDPDAINARLDCVQWLVAHPALHEAVRAKLKQVPDMSRALGRLSVGRGGPRDLGDILVGATVGRAIAALIMDASDPLPTAASAINRDVQAIAAPLCETLRAALAEDLPLTRKDAGFVRAGYHPELDEARGLRDESRRIIASLQQKYAAQTQIKSLKVRHNNVLGYFIEVTANHGDKLMAAPFDETFIHRQTLANAVRFSSVELGELAQKIAAAADAVAMLEGQVFDALSEAVMQQGGHIKKTAHALAILDVMASHAHLARTQNYCRPRVDGGMAFEITDGRHPVVEQVQSNQNSKPFVANTCSLGPPDYGQHGQIWLVTGPNMAGKSTFLRQNALIAILAQMGSYVPATSAHIGVVDQLFSRVGAADDLARGRSTFMVEMIETAAILNQAGKRAFVILDEIGRGTATYDGLSIAWATIEHLHQVNTCRALFATHYHEMTALSQKLDRLKNVTVSVREWKGEVVFLHAIVPGAADRSYGIQVARLAGLPAAVITRASAVLAQLENKERDHSSTPLIDDLPLFSITSQPQSQPQSQLADTHPVLKMLEKTNPDDLTPRDALEILYAMKKQYGIDRDQETP